MRIDQRLLTWCAAAAAFQNSTRRLATPGFGTRAAWLRADGPVARTTRGGAERLTFVDAYATRTAAAWKSRSVVPALPPKILLSGPDFAMHFKRTALTFHRGQNQQKRCSSRRTRSTPQVRRRTRRPASEKKTRLARVRAGAGRDVAIERPRQPEARRRVQVVHVPVRRRRGGQGRARLGESGSPDDDVAAPAPESRRAARDAKIVRGSTAVGYSAETSRGDAAAATWIFRGDGSRRRHGGDVETNRGDAAAATWIFRGDES